MHSVLRGALGLAAGAVVTTGAAGLGALAYANRVELNRFTVRHEQLPLPHGLPRWSGSQPVRLLHISDIHYVPGQQKKFDWLQSLAGFEPDLVINTGDNLSHPAAVPELLEALAPLRRFPGAFVPGSNDYYAPSAKNPLSYLRGPSTHEEDRQELPWREMFLTFGTSGWVELTNRNHATTVGPRPVHLSGTDDAHIGRAQVTGWPLGIADTSALKLGITHSPDSQVLLRFADAGADLILAGHTHGGQVCLPGGRALVTNSDLPASQAKGLSTVTASDGREVPLHVSAGIGTSAKAPIRLNCPPEATILDLVPA